ncbi:MAG: ABC transporter substrate-binding protein [Pirellulaceae bacterium]
MSRVLATFAAVLLSMWCWMTPANAQEEVGIKREEAPLIDREPFDLITLNEEAGSGSFEVFTLDFREMPRSIKDTDKLEVVFLKFPDRRYEVSWKSIKKIDFYETRVYEEAINKMAAKDFIGAFQNLSFLMKNYPEMPRLESLRQEFLLKSAADRFRAGELAQTLSALEELRETAPTYEEATVTRVLSQVAGSMIESFQKSGDLGSAKKLLSRLKSKYGPTLQVVRDWEEKLQQMALAKKDEAMAHMAAKRYRQARQAAVEMVSIFPDLPDGQNLITKINETHPMVRVGVMQRSSELDPSSLVNWPARRTGKLVFQSVFQFLQTGSEGGQYGFALGTYRLSDDRTQLLLSLDPSIQTSLDGFGLAQELLRRADPASEGYDPSWAAIFKSVEATSGTQIVVTLKRPNVLPHALLQWILPDAPDAVGSLPGRYARDAVDGMETSYQIRAGVERLGQPVEIIEIFYDDPKKAVNDLLRGEIDVLDQLYPADAKRLGTDSRLMVGSYALPSTHMLIPVSDDPFLEKDKFRRAMLYATDREAMLRGELLNSSNLNDGRLVSGPFPIGSGESDTLAYAYNPKIAPTEYNPQLAKLLVVMVQNELEAKAEKERETAPKMKKLIVGCPDFEFARVALQAMIQQWKIVGIEAEMLVLPPDETFENAKQCDLIYATTTMWEPATDIERLLGGDGLAATDNPFIIRGLEKLRQARNWREVRTAMQDLHQLVDYHLPVLPLWQIADRFVASRYVEGLRNKPISLYQDVDAWRVNLGFLQTAGR